MPIGLKTKLKQFRLSSLFDGSLPKRQAITHFEFAKLDDSKARELQQISVTAIQQLQNSGEDHLEIESLIDDLAESRYRSAVPLLIQLWHECPILPIRRSVGNALLEYGTKRCLDTLASTIDNHDWWCEDFPVSAILKRDGKRALDSLLPWFDPDKMKRPGGLVVPNAVITCLGYLEYEDSAEKKLKPWLSLLMFHRDHPKLGWDIRSVLALYDVKLIDNWLASNPERKRLRKPRKLDFVDRYLAGDHRKVWNDLRKYDLVSDELREHAYLVSVETMKRANHNVKLLAKRLRARGWKSLSGSLIEKRTKGFSKLVKQFETATGGTIPPSLMAFWKEVGGVDFVWDYRQKKEAPDLCSGPDVSFVELDPLAISLPCEYQLEEYEEKIEEDREVHPIVRQPFTIDLAPDFYHKMDVSGAGPYGIEVPFAGADPDFVMTNQRIPFVDYLRHGLEMAGFPLLSQYASLRSVKEFLATMTADFVDF